MALCGLSGWTWGYDEMWAKTYLEFLDFTHANGRLPMTTKLPSAEKGLGSWGKTQRELLDPTDETDERVCAMNRVPGWSWNPMDEQWTARHAEWRDFVAANNRKPVYRSPSQVAALGPAEQAENSLAIWQKWQRTTPDEHDALNPRVVILSSTPGWTWHPDAARFNERLTQYLAFIRSEGRAPKATKQKASDQNAHELCLAQWGRDQQRAFRKLGPDHPNMVQVASIPGWKFTNVNEPKSREQAFTDNLAAFLAFVNLNGRHPKRGRPNHSAEPGWKHEVALADWGRKAAKLGAAHPRLSELVTIPGWKWGTS